MMPGYGFTNPYGRSAARRPIRTASPTLYRVPGYANTIWLTDEQRVDRDKAVFAQVSWDITPQSDFERRLRYFWYKNSLQGFYGYRCRIHAVTRAQACQCFAVPVSPFAPCTDLDKIS